MPGRNPAEAIEDYREPLQQSLSCVSKCVLRTSGYEPHVLQQVTLSGTTARLKTEHDEVLHLSFVQHFSVTKPLIPLGFKWKITTRAYHYGIEDESHNEIIAYRWHPETSRCQFPHFHLRQNAIGKIHFPTGRIAFEEFCQLLIAEFAVVPERPDAMNVLAGNLQKFKQHKSW